MHLSEIKSDSKLHLWADGSVSLSLAVQAGESSDLGVGLRGDFWAVGSVASLTQQQQFPLSSSILVRLLLLFISELQVL